MLQKILNIKKLFQGNKSKVQIPMNTLYGSKCMFHVANLALISIVIILSIVSVSIYFFMPIVDVSKLSEEVNIREAEEAIPVDVESFDVEEKKIDAYAVIAKKNVFSPQRKDWVVRVVIPNPTKFAKKKKPARKKALAGKPKKIVLHGIVMAGEMKKALISNPLTGVSSKKTLYVEEGDELEGYMVTRIESDQIRLDWQGEEIIVTLYSGIRNNIQAANSSNNNNERKPRRGQKKQRRNSETSKMEYKYKEVESQHAEVDIDVVNEKAVDSFAEISDEMPINLMSMKPEHLFMPVKDDAKLSGEVEIQEVEGQHAVIDIDVANEKAVDSFTKIADEAPINLMSMEQEHLFMPVKDDPKLSEEVEIQEVAETIPDIKFIDVDTSEEEVQKIAKAEIPNPVDLTALPELQQKALSEEPVKVVLYGIVIAGDIKKALVKTPMMGVSDKTLYVEEGDGLEGYKVTSIEPDRLRLDWQGEEMVITFPPLL